MDIRTETTLVQQIVEGDTNEFDRIVELHSGQVMRLAWRLTGNREDAEDLAQEAFLRLYRALPKFRGECTLSTWLYRTVTRLAIDYLRREQVRRRVFFFQSPNDEQDPIETVADPAASPSDRLLQSERRQQIRRALKKLSPRQRTIFVLRNDEGLPLKEISGLLGLEEGTVKVHLHRAVARLEKELAKIVETGQ